MDSDGIQLSDLHIHYYSPAGNEEDKHGEWLNGPAHFDLTLVSIALVLSSSMTVAGAVVDLSKSVESSKGPPQSPLPWSSNEEDKHGRRTSRQFETGTDTSFDLTLVSIELVLGPPTNLRNG